MPGWGVDLGPGRLDSPFGAGDSSGNLKIGGSAGTRRMVYRVVPQKTGTLWDVWLEVKARSGPNCSPQLADADATETNSYSAGNPNNWLWEVRLHPLKNDGSGWFDPTTNLVPAIRFNPYFQRRNTSFQFGADFTKSALKVPVGSAGLAVTAGVPIAITVAPVNGAPGTDYASVNFIYMSNDREGSTTRNEVGTNATDSYYGVDPRVTLGGSFADGSSQWYPGTNLNGAPFSKHLPTMLLAYTDGTIQGQEYYGTASGSDPILAATQYTMNYKVPSATTFTHIRAIFASGIGDSFQAILAVGGVDKGTVTLTSTGTNPGQVVTAKLPAPVPVLTSDTITVRFTPNVQNAVIRIYSNAPFETLLGHGSSYYAWLTGDVNRVVPVMPVPWPFPRLIARSAPTGAPATPVGFTATGASGRVTLAWTANGESYLGSYNVYRDGVLIGTAATNSYSDSTGVVGQSYSYQVSAVALDGRESALCGAQSAASSAVITAAYVAGRGVSAQQGTASLTSTATLSGATSAGNRLVMAVVVRGSTATLSSVTDPRGNTWVVDKSIANAASNDVLVFASAKVATPHQAADVLTLNWSASVGPARCHALHELSGIATTGFVDQSLTKTSAVAGQTSASVGPVTTTVDEEIVMAAFSVNIASFTQGAGYTAWPDGLIATSGATSGDRALFGEYKHQTAQGAQTASVTTPTQGGYEALLVTYAAGA